VEWSKHRSPGGRQASDVAWGGGLFPQPLDLVVLGREPGDGERLERGEPGQGFVPLGDPFLEFGDLGLEPFDLGARGSMISPASCMAVSRRSNSSARCW
jgi:hypothetical protein